MAEPTSVAVAGLKHAQLCSLIRTITLRKANLKHYLLLLIIMFMQVFTFMYLKQRMFLGNTVL